MRLYDFHCASCGKDFEDLMRDVSDARCPACASANVEKQLSAFAVSGTAEAPLPPCATGPCCGGGNCGLN